MRIEELQSVQIELDRTPRVRSHQFGKVIGQLLLGSTVNLVIEALADAADRAGVGINGLGLHPLEIQVLEMRLVVAFKRCGGQRLHLEVTSRLVNQRPLRQRG